MLLLRRDESRAPSLHRARLPSSFSCFSYFCLRSSFLSKNTYLKIYPRFALLHFPRVTLELAEIRETTWGMGFYWTSVASRRSMAVKSTRKGKATMVRGKKEVPDGGRLIGGDGGNTAKTLSAIHRAANATLLRAATSARNNAAVTAPHPCRATANHPFPGIFQRSRWHTTEAVVSNDAVIRNLARCTVYHSTIKFSH